MVDGIVCQSTASDLGSDRLPPAEEEHSGGRTGPRSLSSLLLLLLLLLYQIQALRCLFPPQPAPDRGRQTGWGAAHCTPVWVENHFYAKVKEIKQVDTGT